MRAMRAAFSPIGRWNPSAWTAHSGRRSAERRPPFAALNHCPDAQRVRSRFHMRFQSRCQSRERSGPKARGSERSGVNKHCPALPHHARDAGGVLADRKMEFVRMDRSLWPSFCRTTAPVRGSEPLSRCAASSIALSYALSEPLSEPRAERAAGPRERAVRRQRKLSVFAAPCARCGRRSRRSEDGICPHGPLTLAVVLPNDGPRSRL
jgi:hypothetical protein